MGKTQKFMARVAEVFHDVIHEKVSISQPHRADIRASSMPICYREVLFGRWAEMAGRVPAKEWSLGSATFTGIGNSVHAESQKYLGYAGILWGSWDCTGCGKVWLNQTCPGVCCAALPEYIEYTLVHPDPSIGEFGHCDGLLLISPHEFTVLELKTTGESVAGIRRLKGASAEHIQQVSCYVEMVKRGMARVIKKGPPEPGFPRGRVLWEAEAVMPPGKQSSTALVIYVRRDKPKAEFWIPIPVEPIQGIMAGVERNAPRVQAAVQSGKVVRGRCKKFEDARNPYNWKDVCPWASKICFSPDPADNAEHLFSMAQRGKKEVTSPVPNGGDYIPRK